MPNNAPQMNMEQYATSGFNNLAGNQSAVNSNQFAMNTGATP